MTSPSISQRRAPGVAQLIITGPQAFTIGREPFASIADLPIYGRVEPGSRKPTVTLRFIADTGGLPSTRKRISLPIGLLELVETMLCDAGRPFTVRPNQQLQYRSPHLVPTDSSWTCPELLRRAYGRRCTLAEIPRREQRLQAIAALRMQFPACHIGVVVQNRAEARATAAELSNMIGSHVSWGVKERDAEPWIHVDSVKSFIGLSLEGWGFAVFFDAELALSQTSLNQLAPLVGFVPMGFLTRDERELQQMDRLVLECMFGPVIYRHGDEQNGTEVAVGWLAASSYPPPTSSQRLFQKRQNIWLNDARNLQIAQAAHAFECGGPLAVQRLGLSEAADWISQAHSYQGLTVAIVVENLEHGRELAKRLPDWQLCTTSVPANDDLAPVLGSRTIVTLPRALKSGLASNVVIYAAGTGELWLDCLGPQCELFSGRRMLVLDVADDCDRETVRQSHRRNEDYRHRGWQMFSGGPGVMKGGVT